MHVLAQVRPSLLSTFAALCLLLAATAAPAQDLRPAEQAVLQGRAAEATALLRSALDESPDNAAAHLLLCRNLLAEEHAAEAAAHCGQALNAGLSQDSAAQDWAGRAFGLQAQTAGPLAGLKLAVQVRNAFGNAYRLNPRNQAAANDLGEYYIDAPFVVGGGIDKASALAHKLEPTLPQTAHRLLALAAEEQGDPATAEREFLAATAVAQASGAYADLANFYVRQHNLPKAIEAARRGIALNRAFDANVIDNAAALNDAHQTPAAIEAMRAYLAHGQKSDQAPAFRVDTMLGHMFAAQGDKAAARSAFNAALQLAPEYTPARKGLNTL